MAERKPPRTKSIVRASKSALTKDEKARLDQKKKTVDSFVNFSMNLGIGSDNPMTDSTYGFNPITRNRTLLEWIHRGSWLGGVAIDVVADDMTRAGVELLGTLKPDQIEAINEDATALGIWNSTNEGLKWARLYGGGILVHLVDGQDMESPLRMNTIRKGQYRGVLALDRWMVEPSLNDLVTDFGPDMGLPKYYSVVATAPGLARMRIHHSRCFRLEGIKLPYWQRLMENLWGLSVMERFYDRMVAYDSASTGAAQLVYKAYLRTFKIENMRELVAAGGDAEMGLIKYVEMARRFQGIEGMTIIDSKDDFQADAHSAFGGLSDALAQFGQQLSGALQIPLVRLFGQSPLGFSTGETDLRNYYDTIKQQQEKQLRVGMTKIYRMLAASAGIQVPEGFKLDFRSLWQLTETEKGEIANRDADTISKAEESGLIDKPTALKELRQSSQVTGRFTNITEEMIAEAELEPPPLPEGEDETDGGEDEEKVAGHELVPSKVGDAAPMAAGILMRNPANQILVLKRSDTGAWDLPGGHAETGESFAKAALRESREEVGHTPKKLDLLDHTTEHGLPYSTFKSSVDHFEPTLNSEHTAYRWVTKEDALDMNLHPGLRATLIKHGDGY
jgi:uncharacterized protein